MRSCLERIRRVFATNMPANSTQTDHLHAVEQHDANSNKGVQRNANEHYPPDNVTSYEVCTTTTKVNSSKKRVASHQLENDETNEIQVHVYDDIPNYIDEYKSFVEEKQQLISTPYSTPDCFDFEKILNLSTSRRHSATHASSVLRQLRNCNLRIYKENTHGHSSDAITSLSLDQAPSRPSTFPKEFRKLGEPYVENKLEFVRHNTSIQRTLNFENQRNQKQNYITEETSEEVLLRRKVSTNEEILNSDMLPTSLSLFERRQPHCPKLKLSLKKGSKDLKCKAYSSENYESHDALLDFEVLKLTLLNQHSLLYQPNESVFKLFILLRYKGFVLPYKQPHDIRHNFETSVEHYLTIATAQKALYIKKKSILQSDLA